MFIWLTNPTIGQVLVNLNLVIAVTCVQGRNTVCFTGGEEDYIVVTESLEDIYERFSPQKRGTENDNSRKAENWRKGLRCGNYEQARPW